MRFAGYRLKRLLAAGAALAMLPIASPAIAQQTNDLDALRVALDLQERQLEEQRRLLDQQAAELKAQRAQLDSLSQKPRLVLEPDQIRPLPLKAQAEMRAAGAPEQVAATSRQPMPDRPVGEAPPARPVAPELAALPEGVGVLTPAGRFVIDPTIDFTNSSSNRLVFRGVEIVTGVQVGVIEASDADRNAFTAAVGARYGLTDRLEIEARVPYVYRTDTITTLVQRDTAVTSTMDLDGSDIGDVELTARYQLTDGRNGSPVYVANLRVKSDTGTGPFDVSRDTFGVATELPTGSGFWGVEPSLTVLIPSDPAVIFANVGYLYHAPGEIDQVVNGVAINDVDPGDSINASLGFGFAVNQQFSFSLGYRHSYIFPTETQIEGVRRESEDLQAGSLQFGWSWRLADTMTFNNNFEFGVTEDAPDVRIVFRLPVAF